MRDRSAIDTEAYRAALSLTGGDRQGAMAVVRDAERDVMREIVQAMLSSQGFAPGEYWHRVIGKIEAKPATLPPLATGGA